MLFWAQWGILNYERYRFILDKFGDFESAWNKITTEDLLQMNIRKSNINLFLSEKEKVSSEKFFDEINNYNIRIISIDNIDYPELLKQISDPPPFLFIRGKIPSLHKSIGIVGTRNITPYGQMVSENFTRDLVNNGFVIVSGLALGIDSSSHESCIKNSGITVAVMGSGVDKIYPPSNYNLAQKILDNNGALISEFPIGTTPLNYHFPRRNRIISGLSKGIVVVEGGKKSGALITARMALEQGREVFAVPNNITKTCLSGTNYLIRKGEAKLIESVEHILEEFNMDINPKIIRTDFTDDEKIILKLLSSDMKSFDELMIEFSSIQKLSSILTALSLKGAIKESSNSWMLA